MSMRVVVLLATFLCSLHSYAQDDLFGLQKPEAKHGFLINVNGALDVPGGDMADRFGPSYKLGGALLYKTKSNWVFGPKVDFIFGDILREDTLMDNIKSPDGSYISLGAERIGVNIYERGYMIGLQGGKIFNISKKNSDNGIMVATSVGFIQHKIFIRDRDALIGQLRGDYIKGYDRLTNGWFLEQYVGYAYFATNSLINFHIGLDITAGFTAGRRSYQYDLMRADNASRVDILFGIRGGWYIPIFKRKSEELFFE